MSQPTIHDHLRKLQGGFKNESNQYVDIQDALNIILYNQENMTELNEMADNGINDEILIKMIKERYAREQKEELLNLEDKDDDNVNEKVDEKVDEVGEPPFPKVNEVDWLDMQYTRQYKNPCQAMLIRAYDKVSIPDGFKRPNTNNKWWGRSCFSPSKKSSTLCSFHHGRKTNITQKDITLQQKIARADKHDTEVVEESIDQLRHELLKLHTSNMTKSKADCNTIIHSTLQDLIHELQNAPEA